MSLWWLPLLAYAEPRTFYYEPDDSLIAEAQEEARAKNSPAWQGYVADARNFIEEWQGRDITMKEYKRMNKEADKRFLKRYAMEEIEREEAR